jgi:hypothetical protein
VSDDNKCTKCGRESNPLWLCDEEPMGQQWCEMCFLMSACGHGKHGEGCPTTVFSNVELPTQPKKEAGG